MKNLSKIALALGLLAFGTQAFADVQCPPTQRLKKIGSDATATSVITAQGQLVRAIDVQCTSSACTAGFYDTTVVASTTAANLVMDIGAAASTHILVPIVGFLDSPISFDNGVVMVSDGNVASATIMSCQ